MHWKMAGVDLTCRTGLDEPSRLCPPIHKASIWWHLVADPPPCLFRTMVAAEADGAVVAEGCAGAGPPKSPSREAAAAASAMRGRGRLCSTKATFASRVSTVLVYRIPGKTGSECLVYETAFGFRCNKVGNSASFTSYNYIHDCTCTLLVQLYTSVQSYLSQVKVINSSRLR